jgi:hypothetical protein
MFRALARCPALKEFRVGVRGEPMTTSKWALVQSNPLQELDELQKQQILTRMVKKQYRVSERLPLRREQVRTNLPRPQHRQSSAW